MSSEAVRMWEVLVSTASAKQHDWVGIGEIARPKDQNTVPSDARSVQMGVRMKPIVTPVKISAVSN